MAGRSSASRLRSRERMEEERAAYDQLFASVEEALPQRRADGRRRGAGALSRGHGEPDCRGDGPGATEADVAGSRSKQRMVDLLTAYVNGSQQEVRVVVGLDEASPAMQGPGADWRPGAAGRDQPGDGRSDRPHAHPIPGDDPGCALCGRDFRSAYWRYLRSRGR